MRDVVKNGTSVRNSKSKNPQIKHVKKKRRRKRNLTLYYILTFIVVTTCALVLSLTVFFRIEQAEVVGTSRYSVEEIMMASGVNVGDNMFRTQMSEVQQRIESAFPYIESVKAERSLPSGIKITVAEATPKFVFVETDIKYLVSQNGKVLEKSSGDFDGDYIKVTGFGIDESNLNKNISAVDTPKEEVFSSLIEYLENIEFEKIKSVDMRDVGNIILSYDGRITIELGNSRDLEDKIRQAKSIIDNKVADDFKGKMIIWDTNSSSLIPEE